MREIRRYPNAEFMWAQEEPKNMGAYSHIQPRLQRCLEVGGGWATWPARDRPCL